MNRYDIEGLARDMHKGRRIVAVYGTNRDARAALESVWSRELDGSSRVRRSSGLERIEHLLSGGLIRFISVRGQGARGIEADILYLDVEVTDEAMHSLTPSIQASPYAEVLRR